MTCVKPRLTEQRWEEKPCLSFRAPVGDPGLSSNEGLSTAGLPNVVLLASRLLDLSAVSLVHAVSVPWLHSLSVEGPKQVSPRYVVRWPGQAWVRTHIAHIAWETSATVYSSACLSA